MTVAASLVLKAKKRKPTYTKGKRGEPGRFVTLKSGRVIFIPKGQRTKWADVKDKVMTSQKKEKSLHELAKMRPDSSIPPDGGVEKTYVNTYPDGSKALWKINEHGAAESEVLAYEFSESIGWGIVPETIMPEGTKDVSMQRWIEDGHTFSMEPVAERRVKPPEMLIMDTLLGNTDRHGSNCLIDKNGKVWAIDNNMAFDAVQYWGEPEFHYSSKYVHSFVKGKVLTKDGAGLKRAALDLDRWRKTPAFDEYAAQVEELLGKRHADTFRENARLLAEWGHEAKVVGRDLTVKEVLGLE